MNNDEIRKKVQDQLGLVETDVTEMLATIRAIKGINYSLCLNSLFNIHTGFSVLAGAVNEELITTLEGDPKGVDMFSQIISKTCAQTMAAFTVLTYPQPRHAETGKDIDPAPRLVQDHLNRKRAQMTEDLIKDLGMLLDKAGKRMEEMKQ